MAQEDYQIYSTAGFTSKIYLLPEYSPPRVCKAFNTNCTKAHYPAELAAYTRFASHDPPASIPTFYGLHDTIPFGLVLSLAEHKDVFFYLLDQERHHNWTPNSELLLKWAAQITEALTFAHGLGVLNSDIHLINCLLDGDLNLLVADWAGASIDGSRSHSTYRLRHRLFDGEGRDIPRAEGISVKTEIFALGTALYSMVSGQQLWGELREPRDREEIKRRIVRREWPDLSGLKVLRDVIARCWAVGFESMEEVGAAVEEERERWARAKSEA